MTATRSFGFRPFPAVVAGLGLALVGSGPAAAVILHGSFAGIVTAGLDPTMAFGSSDLTSMNYTGTLHFDPDAFAPIDNVVGQYEIGALYTTPNLLSMTITINGQTRTVLSDYFARIAYDYPGGVHGLTKAEFAAHPATIDRVSSLTLQVHSYTNPFLTPDAGLVQAYAVAGEPSSAWFTVLADDNTTQYQINMTVTSLAVEAPAPAGLPVFLAGLGALGWLRRRPRQSKPSSGAGCDSKLSVHAMRCCVPGEALSLTAAFRARSRQ
jgi:hypothetical protein